MVAPNPVNVTVVPVAPEIGEMAKKFGELVIVRVTATTLVPSLTNIWYWPLGGDRAGPETIGVTIEPVASVVVFE